MAGANLGNFAGSFADSFSKIYFAKKQQKSQEELAKLQGKLVEAQLKAQAMQQEALGEVNDAMSGTRLGEFNIGPRTPVEGMPGLERPNITNPAAESNARGPQDLMSILTDASMADVQGLLITSGLLKPADIMRFQTEKRQLDQQEEWQKKFGGLFQGGEGGGMSGMSPGPVTLDSRGNIQMSMVPNADIPTPRGFADQITDVQVLIGEAEKIAPAMQRLEGTPLAIGGDTKVAREIIGTVSQFPEWARGPTIEVLAKQYNMTPEQFMQMLTDYDVVNKSFSAIGAAAMSGATTDTARTAIQSSLPEITKTPQANIEVIVQHLGTQIQRLQNTGKQVPPELIAAYEDAVQKLRAYGGDQTSSGGLILGYFTEAEWNALTPEEQAEAQRLLGGGR